MYVSHVGGRRYSQFDRLRDVADLIHAFSTRPANPGPRNGPAGARDRVRMAADWGLPAERLCFCRQVHETRIAIVTSPDDCGLQPGSDAIVTPLPNVALMTFSADCPLVLLFDPRRHVLALAHASWRCTVAVLTPRVIQRMHAAFGSRPRDLLAGIGPSAGPCCYEVKDDVFHAAGGLPGRDGFFARRDGRMYFDLWRANESQLLAAGVLARNIEPARVCTICGDESFYSLRREGPGCGHFALLAAMACT